MTYITYQIEVDEMKVNAIIDDMKNNGWIGAPIVVWDDTLVTGNHRYAACQEIDMEPETIELSEVFEEDGLNFEEEHAIAGYPCSSDNLAYFLSALSDEIINKYGIQF